MKMDGTELDGLVEYLRGKDFCPEAADVITAMRAEIADLSLQACQDGDLISELIAELNEQTHRGDQAEQRVATLEAALAAQIEADAGLCEDSMNALKVIDATGGEILVANALALRIRNQPHDRTALDRYREKVLREVLEKAKASFYGVITQDAILALIEKPQCA